MTTDLRELAAITALNEMMSQRYFSICTIDTVGKLLNRNPAGDAYNILHSLHCIHFDRMPQELRDAIPALIEQCLDGRDELQWEEVDEAQFGGDE